jgi:hypothetical protein
MYSIDNKPEYITADYLLSRLKQEDIWEYYTSMTPDSSCKVCNTLRNDTDAGCSFYFSSGYWWLNDFAWKKQFNCFTAIMQKFNISYPKALELVYDDMIGGKNISIICNYTSLQKVKKTRKTINVKHQPFTSTDISYLKSFYISSFTCQKFKVFSIKHYWIDGILAYTYSNNDPCLGYYFGNGEWKLYHYLRGKKEIRFVGSSNKETLQGYNQLAYETKKLIVTKSYKDVMVYSELGYSAIAPHSEGLSDWDKKLEILKDKFETIYLNFDNDEPGIQATIQVIEKHNYLIPVFIPKESETKDISDYIKKYGKEQTINLITNENSKNFFNQGWKPNIN